MENVVVLIEGEKIKAVGQDVAIPPDAQVIDLRRATVLPGLIDAHTHLLLQPYDYDTQLLKESVAYRAIQAAVAARTMLEAGFTSVRDVETEGAGYADVALKTAINKGLVPGPRLQCATRALSSTGSYPLLGYAPEVPVPSGVQVADGVEGVRFAVREQIKYGADLIKFYADSRRWSPTRTPSEAKLNYTQEEMNAIVDEARRLGRPVAAHAYLPAAAQAAIRAGVISIEHGLFLDDETFKLMAAKGVYWCPTLYAYYSTLEENPQDTIYQKLIRDHREVFQRALRARVKIAFGSDAGAFPHGKAYRELELMAEYGMAPMNVIQSATSVAAELLGWQDRLGTIEPGKLADVVAVAGDPLIDIHVFRKVPFVMKGGQVVKHEKF